jgi:hypothetical protein
VCSLLPAFAASGSKKMSRSLAPHCARQWLVVRQVCACLRVSAPSNPSDRMFPPEFELDSDEIDNTEDLDVITPTGRRIMGDGSMPLLVGLMDFSHARADRSIPMTSNGNAEEYHDLEELAAKRTAGGGLVDSIANMANSILGAGTVFPTCLHASID